MGVCGVSADSPYCLRRATVLAASRSFTLSACLHAALALAVGEPWDTWMFAPALALLSAWIGLTTRHPFVACLALISGQWMGWLMTALFRTDRLAWWPVVTFFTLPLFVVPIALVGLLTGTLVRSAGMRLKRAASSRRRQTPAG